MLQQTITVYLISYACVYGKGNYSKKREMKQMNKLINDNNKHNPVNVKACTILLKTMCMKMQFVISFCSYLTVHDRITVK